LANILIFTKSHCAFVRDDNPKRARKENQDRKAFFLSTFRSALNLPMLDMRQRTAFSADHEAIKKQKEEIP
jgi:hypothetical protein